MVYGKSSKFTEGFTDLTNDDKLMMANMQQALLYSKHKMGIPDPKIKVKTGTIPLNVPPENLPEQISSYTTQTTIPMATETTNAMMIPPNFIMQGNTPMMQSSMSTPMMQSSMSTPTMMQSSMSTPTMMQSSRKKTPTNTMSNNSSNNLSNKSVSSFKNIPRVINDGSDKDDDETVLEEDVYNNEFEEEDSDNEDDDDYLLKKNNNSSKTKRHNMDIEEGFLGSLEIESRNVRNILLALLLSCIGYLVVYSMINNLLPLDDISPQLKKFKRVIYASLFFLITYICLEVF